MLNKYLNNRFNILYLIPFVGGSLATLSFEPFNLIAVNFVILPILFYFIVYINKKSKVIYRKRPYKKNLFIFGLLFGFGFYLSGISWISNSLTFDESFKILIPIAVIVIPLLLSIFMALTILLVGPYLKFDLPSLFLLSGSLAFSDYLRSKLFTGFPWNLWAYSSSTQNEIIQILNVIGLHSYNLIAITLFILPATMFFKMKTVRKIISFILIACIILSLHIYGNYKINKNKNYLTKVKDKVYVKVISPKFDLEYGLSADKIEERFKRLVRYSDPDKNRKTLFIWPEGVFSGYSFSEILVFKKIISKNFSKNHFIVLGVNKIDPLSGNFYNSMLILNNNFEIVQSYNKKKLVPFGEFLPFADLLKNFGLKKITEGHGSFLKGNGNKNLTIDKLNILPLICYEVIFTELIQKSDKKTNLIINISEDGWFGNSIGPDQHFAKAIFRAIENNTFFLRSANMGTSAVIDNNGYIIKKLSRNEAGNIEFETPLIKSKKIKNDLIFYLLLITYLFIFLNYRKKYAKQ
tara:strand:+ start:692 stop:2254 length:1563 start_codon:yes stop_codon:yes gene_type:complete